MTDQTPDAGSSTSPREFVDTDLRGARFQGVDLTGATIEHTYLNGLRVRDCELLDVEITADLSNVVINGVDVVPLIEAELDRRDPDRVQMRPVDPDGFRHAWDVVEQLWDGTVARARSMDPALLHESVGGEWSFIQTLRHLVFATQAWVARGILGEPAPWHPLSLPWDQMEPREGVPQDRDARPSLDEVLAMRADGTAIVRRVVDGLSEEQLAGESAPMVGIGWPDQGRVVPVRDALLTVLNEEYLHRLYAERDLDVLLDVLAGGSS